MQQVELSNESSEPLVYIIAENINYNLIALTLVFVDCNCIFFLLYIYLIFKNSE